MGSLNRNHNFFQVWLALMIIAFLATEKVIIETTSALGEGIICEVGIYLIGDYLNYPTVIRTRQDLTMHICGR